MSSHLQQSSYTREVMTAYRDAIQYVHDQTVRLMNKGLTGRQCAEVESWWCDNYLASHGSIVLIQPSHWLLLSTQTSRVRG